MTLLCVKIQRVRYYVLNQDGGGCEIRRVKNAKQNYSF